jgi:hypothetical protein
VGVKKETEMQQYELEAWRAGVTRMTTKAYAPAKEAR